MSDNEDIEKTKSLISTGAEIAGAAVGGAIGFFAAGPAGAAGAGTLGVILAKAGAKLLGDIAERTLSDREKIRIGAAAAIAFDKIEKNTQAGVEPRKDGFFEPKDGERCKAQEVLEGTLRRAREEYEEKKIAFLGNFYANMVYSPGVSVEEANYYLRLFDSLTYRQLCVVCLIFMKPHYPDFQSLRSTDYRTNNQNMSASTVTLLQEIFALYSLGFICCKNPSAEGYSALLGWHDVNPKCMELTGLGERFRALFMGGGNIVLADIASAAGLLR